MGTIISCFATCGKSVLGKKYKNVIDLNLAPLSIYTQILQYQLKKEKVQKGI